MSNIIIKYYPAFYDFEPDEKEFSTIEELLSIPWINYRLIDPRFVRFSIHQSYNVKLKYGAPLMNDDEFKANYNRVLLNWVCPIAGSIILLSLHEIYHKFDCLLGVNTDEDHC